MTNPDHEDRGPERAGGLVRRVLSPGPGAEERLEELLEHRRHELDEHAARLHESIAELERREELLRDSRASVERMLRVGTTDLEAREIELARFLDDLTEREANLAEAEADVARRRQDLGAVELRRAAVERRERAAAVREDELAPREAELATRIELELEPPVSRESAKTELAFVPDGRYRLLEIPAKVLALGDAFEDADGDDAFVVARIGPSPLPGDDRRCAYLVRGPRPVAASSGGSS